MVLSIRVRAPQIILELRSGRMPRDFTLSQGSNFDLCEYRSPVTGVPTVHNCPRCQFLGPGPSLTSMDIKDTFLLTVHTKILYYSNPA